MANANPVIIQPEVRAKDELKAMAKGAHQIEAQPAVDPSVPVAGDSFTPEKGKKGVYHSLQGPAPVLVRIVTH